MFGDEIQSTKQEILDEGEEYSALAPHFAGRALNLRLKGKRLERIKEALTRSSWMPYCSMSEEVYHQYDIVVGSIRDAIIGLYHKWTDDIGDNPALRLDRYLMRGSIDNPGLLETNIDPSILNLCREARHWSALGFEIPVPVQVINDKWDTLQFVYESVRTVVLSYNKIIEGNSQYIHYSLVF